MEGGALVSLEDFARRLRRTRLRRGAAAQRVVTTLTEDPIWVLQRSSLDIAARARTSDATVIRTIQALGFAGLNDFKQQIEAAARNRCAAADLIERTARDLKPGAGHAFAEAIRVHRRGLAAIRKLTVAGTVQAAVETLCEATRIVLAGPPGWAGCRELFRQTFSTFGLEAIAVEASSGPDPLSNLMAILAPGDVPVILAIPPLDLDETRLAALTRATGRRIIVVTNAPGGTGGNPNLILLCVPSGQPGHIDLAGPMTALMDVVALGLATCCPERTLERLRLCQVCCPSPIVTASIDAV
jgi:DNA-binding MurR/RpiR family transcriptional regulator